MFNYSTCIGLDFETYGDVSLPDYGLDNYVNGEFFQPLIASTYDKINGTVRKERFDFTVAGGLATQNLKGFLHGRTIIAHNAGFEQAVLDSMGIEIPSKMFIDSAAVARAAGAAGKLEAAAPQLLGVDKMEEGWPLIKLFSIPGSYQERNGHMAFDPQVIKANPEKWATFHDYCDLDAELGYLIAEMYHRYQDSREHGFNAITMDMNLAGWPVDRDLLQDYIKVYERNLEQANRIFREAYDPKEELNLNSLKQLKEWCAERGIKATSFNEANVSKLLARIEKKLPYMPTSDPKRRGYFEVTEMLRTKQILGGSSLKKLDVIARNMSADGRLRDQYLHAGAGQTLRTSGRSVQMQNLKRLGPEPDDVTLVDTWDNDTLARNLRQLFTASHPGGALIVGDFSSVESRGLAYLADEDWKTKAYFEGKDLYKVLAEKIFSVSYNAVTKTQRQTGKVGELSCGYGAGAGAVVSFAEGMGVEMTEAEASTLVLDWRLANPKIVNFWNRLDDMLQDVVRGVAVAKDIRVGGGRYSLQVARVQTPQSLLEQHGTARTIMVSMSTLDGTIIFQRYFHGCYIRGNNICYYRPSERKTGNLWSPTFTNPKTKQEQYYSVYGGKLAGIITQSFCREIFFWVLREVSIWAESVPNVELIGQFHDEIVLDWKPSVYGGLGLAEAEAKLEQLMSDAGPFIGFPLAAEIKHDYRYTK